VKNCSKIIHNFIDAGGKIWYTTHTNERGGVYLGFLYETHMHTSEVSGCASSPAAHQIVAYKNKGYTGVIITDHFINGYNNCPRNLSWDTKMRYFVLGYKEAKKAGKKYGVDVFLGWEFTVKGADFLTYGLDLEFLFDNPHCDKLGIEAYSKLVRRSGGYLAQAHPYRDEYYIEHNYPVAPHLIDGIEVYNAMDKSLSNAKALAYAKNHNIPMQAGTDSHSIRNTHYSGILLEKKADCIQDIIRAIMTRKATIVQEV